MKEHKLKTWPKQFSDVKQGRKNFEVRVNDRGFLVGDRLILQEWNPESGEYTGAALVAHVKYIMHGGQFGLPDDLCVMGI